MTSASQTSKVRYVEHQGAACSIATDVFNPLQIVTSIVLRSSEGLFFLFRTVLATDAAAIHANLIFIFFVQFEKSVNIFGLSET